tara:strand:- start:622 stop:1644 length:1023 start_codon:yes stop_codon:yes gene_type:complete
MGEAMRGGYQMPFSKGGILPKFSAGGKFDPKKFAEGSHSANRLVLNDKSYYVNYSYEPESGIVQVKQIQKRISGGKILGMGSEERAPLKPDSEEFKAVMMSGGLKTDIAGRHQTFGRKGTSTPAEIKEIKIHPQADKAYWYNKSYQDHLKLNGGNKQAAASAASMGAQIDPITKQSVLPGADNEFAAPETMKDAVVTEKDRQEEKAKEEAAKETKTDKKDESIDDKIKRLFGAEGLFQKGLQEFGKNAELKPTTTNNSGATVEEAQQKKTESRLDNLKKMTQDRDAALQPIIQEQQSAPIMGGGGDEIIIPTHNTGDADDYLISKFGIVAEARSTLANFM